MAHDWLGELFRRWGQTPARGRSRARLSVESLDQRVTPSAVKLPATMADGRPRFQPGPSLVVSQTEVMAQIKSDDPLGLIAAAAAQNPQAGRIDLSRSFSILTNPDEGTLVQVGITTGADPIAVVRWLESVQGVSWADPNYGTKKDLRAAFPNDPPNDPQYSLQTHLTQIGAPTAWNVTTGTPNIVVAVIDDGVAINHEDLKPNIWTNPRDTSVPNEQGYVGDVHGWDFISTSDGVSPPGFGDNDPNPMGADSHGTHVAGLIAASTNNGIGVAGVAGGNGSANSGVRIMPLRIFPEASGLPAPTFFSLLPRAMAYAADNGAKLINASLGISTFADTNGVINPSIIAGLDYATRKGVLQFFAAGNDGISNYTGQYVKDWLLVASVSSDPANPDRASDFSNYGPGIALSAPGSFAENNFDFFSGKYLTTRGITSTLTANNGTASNYGSYQVVNGQPELWVGTSMATPVVTGAAALIWSAHPDWNRFQVAAQLLGTTDNIDALNQANGKAGLLGTGRVNVGRALTETLAAPRFTGSTLPAEGATVTTPTLPGGGFTLNAPFRFDPATVVPSSFELREAGADGQFGTADDSFVPIVRDQNRPYQVGDNEFTFSVPALGTGKYEFIARSGGLRDPFGTPLDGNGDGTGGDDFVRTFSVQLRNTVSGIVFEDADGNGRTSAGELGVAGVRVFLDRNGNKTYDTTEPSVLTDAGGRFRFTGVAAGATLSVGVVPPTGWLDENAGRGPQSVTVPAAGTLNGVDFGLVRANGVYGRVFLDANQDGKYTPGESGVPGTTVFLDTNGNGVYDPPSTTTPTTVTATNTPLDIPDGGLVTAPLEVTGVVGQIVAVTVSLDITHGYLFDLAATLIAPDGTRVPLFYHLNWLTPGFSGTVFDDAASKSITDPLVQPPFTGRFRPQGKLSTLAGKPANGRWQLEVGDAYFPDAGTLDRFSLTFTTSVGDQLLAPAADGTFRFDAPAGDSTVRLVRQRGLKLSTPGGFAVPVTVGKGTVNPQAVFGLVRDTVSPRLLSFKPNVPSVTNVTTLSYTVAFSELLDSLTAANFNLTYTGFGGVAPVLQSVVPTATPGVYTVTVTTPTGVGTVGLSLPAPSPLTDPALNPVPLPFAVDAGAVTVDTVAPVSSLALTPAAVFTSAAWPGQLSGTATDVGAGVASVLVSIQQAGTNLYYDGTSFASTAAVSVPAVVNPVTGTWTLSVPAGVLNEGLYTVSEAATDYADNPQATANAATFGIDNGSPSAVITPAGGAFVNTDPILFLIRFSEPVSGNVRNGLTVTGGTIVSVTGSVANYTATVKPAGSGPVTLRLAAAAASDFAGNANTAATADVTFDGTPPTVSLPAGEDGQAVTAATWSGAITGTTSDDLGTVAKVQVAISRTVDGADVYWDGTAFTAAAPVFLDAVGTANWRFAFPTAAFPADDVYRFLVRATDPAGNVSTSRVTTFFDNAAPAPSVAAPAGGALVNAAKFDAATGVTGTASDATSGPALTEVAVRRTADGFYFDGTGFVASGSPLFVPAGGTAAAWGLPTLTSDRLADGQYQVTVRTTDRAGNVGTTSATFTYDNTPAVPADLVPANGAGFNAAGWPNAVSGRVVDSGDTAGVAVAIKREVGGTATYWNGSFFGSATPLFLTATVSVGPGGTNWTYPFSPFGFPSEGRYSLTAVATDKAGNTGTTTSDFSFDNSAPTTTVTPPSTATIFSPATLPAKLTGTAADTLSGVGLVQVSLRQVSTGRFFNGAGFVNPTETKLAAVLDTPNGQSTGWSFSLPATALPADGLYLINAYAIDVAGNAQAFGTPYTFTFDATPPQAVVQADKGAVTNVAPLSFSVAFTSAVGDLDPAGLAVTNGSVLDVTRKSDSSFVVRVTPAADGAVTLSVLPTAARDAAGNPTLPAGPAVGQFDRTPPTITLIAPAGVVPLGEPVTVTATLSEPVPGFGAGSLTATNAAILGVTGSGTSYQIKLLPNGPGAVGLGLVPGALVDAAGNASTAAVSLTRSAEDPRYAVAVAGVVRTYDNRNALRGQAAPFGDGYAGSVRVASADFNGDGIPDVVAGTGPGVTTRVVILDGKTFTPLLDFQPFEDGFTGGVYVAAGDLTGDGTPDLVVTPDEGGGPRVRVFDGKSFGQIADFFGIADSAFRGGARAAVGDINGDGAGDLVVAAGFGGGPRVAVFDGTTVSRGEANIQRLVADFFAYEPTLRNGANVSVGDLDGDGLAELVTAGGPGGGPRVSAFSGSELTAGRFTRTVDFFAGDPNSRDGVHVAVKRMETNAPAELVVGGAGANTLTVYTAAALKQSPPVPSFDQDLLPGVSGGGVFVG